MYFVRPDTDGNLLVVRVNDTRKSGVPIGKLVSVTENLAMPTGDPEDLGKGVAVDVMENLSVYNSNCELVGTLEHFEPTKGKRCEMCDDNYSNIGAGGFQQKFCKPCFISLPNCKLCPKKTKYSNGLCQYCYHSKKARKGAIKAPHRSIVNRQESG